MSSRGRLIDHLLRLLLLAAAAAATLQPVRSFDFWWHLASGRLMAAEGRLLHADPFSFTRPGTPWLNHEWLVQLGGYLGYRAAGEWFPALGVMALAVATYLALSACLLRASAGSGGVWLLLALSLAGARFRFDPRPEMVSCFFLALLCCLLDSSTQNGKERRAWLLFPLFALWANVHPAVLLGAAVTVLWLAGESIQRRLQPGFAAGRRRFFIILGSLGAILLNPGGWRLLTIPWGLRRIIASGHAPNMEWAPPSVEDFPLFFFAALAAGGVLLLVLLQDLPFLRRLRGRATPPGPVPEEGRGGWREAAAHLEWAPVLAACFAALLALQQLRNIAFFFLLLPLALRRPLARLLAQARVPETALRLLEGSVSVLLIGIFLRAAPAWRHDRYLALITPSRAGAFLESNDVGRRLFNDVKFGGYLAWTRYPAGRVFIDGRNEIYDSLLEEVFASLASWERWEALLERYGIDAAMLRRGQLQAVQYAPEAPGAPPRREMRAFSAAYFQPVRWALVYWDDDALVFVRRDDPRYRNLLAREFRIVNPDDSAHLLAEIRKGRVDRSLALAEVDRKLKEDPGCVTALGLRRELQAAESAAAR